MKNAVTLEGRDEIVSTLRLSNTKPIYDAEPGDEILLHVSEDMCLRGRRGNMLNCVIAIAAQKWIPDLVSVRVLNKVTFVERRDVILRFRNSEAMRAMITRFDSAHRFIPGGYELCAVRGPDLDRVAPWPGKVA
jgi:hypothetical protein